MPGSTDRRMLACWMEIARNDARAARRWLGGAAAFCLVAILNCGGYRYGIGDQAFYVPAVVQHLNPGCSRAIGCSARPGSFMMLRRRCAPGERRPSGLRCPRLFFVHTLCLVLLFGAARGDWPNDVSLLVDGRAAGRAADAAASHYADRRKLARSVFPPADAGLRARTLGGGVRILRGEARWRWRSSLAFVMHPTTAVWFGVWMWCAGGVGATWRAPLWPLRLAAAAVCGR